MRQFYIRQLAFTCFCATFSSLCSVSCTAKLCLTSAQVACLNLRAFLLQAAYAVLWLRYGVDRQGNEGVYKTENRF